MPSYRKWMQFMLCIVLGVASVSTVLALQPEDLQTTYKGLVTYTYEEDLINMDSFLTNPPSSLLTTGLTPIGGVSFGVGATAAGNINITLNGEYLMLNEPIKIIESSTFVPFKSFCEALSCEITGETESSITVKRGSELTMELDLNTGLVKANDRYFFASEPPRNIDGVLMLPIRALEKIFTLSIGWDEDTKTVILQGGEVLEHADSFYNSTDLKWLSQIIHAESQGEPLEGKIAVGNVVLNRVESPLFPNTIYDVVFDSKHGVQFTPTSNGAIYNTPNAESVIAAKLCLEGYEQISEGLYFLNASISSDRWIAGNRTFIAQIGSHSFFS